MTDQTDDIIKPFTVLVSAAELPEPIVKRFPRQPPPDARFALTVEPVETETAKLESLRRDLQAGLDDIAAARLIEGDALFAELRALFPPE
jgi:hypothetical protein